MFSLTPVTKDWVRVGEIQISLPNPYTNWRKKNTMKRQWKVFEFLTDN